MYIDRVPNRQSPPAVLLRESYREGKKVRKRTLANLSKLPDSAIDGLQVLLKGGTVTESFLTAFNHWTIDCVNRASSQFFISFIHPLTRLKKYYLG